MDRLKTFQNERKSSLRQPKTSFVKSRLYENCLFNLEKNSLILILGKAGAGKTRYGLELWKEVSGGSNSFIVENPRELDFFGLTGKFAVFYDDIFGQYAEDVKQTTVWYHKMTKLINLSVKKRRLKVILTCRTEIYDKCKDRKELDVFKKYIFDLSEHEMTEKEKEEIAVMFGLAPSLCQKKSTEVGFPRCCELLTCLAKFKISESDMFNKTSEVIKSYINGMLYENRAQYYSLFLTLVFGNKLCLVNVTEQEMIKLADMVGLPQQNIRETVSESLQQLDGSLLSCKENVYSLSNNSLFDIAISVFVKQYPDVFMKYSDVSFLEYICDNFLELDKKSFEQCSKRLIDEKEQLIELKLFRILTNVNVFHHYLSSAGGEVLRSFEFFWYLCWTEDSSIIELMLPLMSNVRDLIDRCSECCTNYFKDHLQLLMSKQDKRSTTTLYTRLSRDLSDQVGQMSFSNIPLLRAECEIGDFPRYRYHYKLTRRLSDNLAKLRSSCPALEIKLKQMIPWQQIKENPVVIIGGKRHEDSEWAFISRDKRNVSECAFEITEVHRKGMTFSSFEDIAPTCLVWYVHNEDSDDVIREKLEQVAGDFVKSTFAVPGASSVIVVMTTIERRWLEEMKIVRLPEVRFVVATDEKSLRGHITSTLEQTMVEYIQMLKEKVTMDNNLSIPSEIFKKLDDVKTEIEGVLHRLNASSTFTKIKQTSSSHRSMSVPGELQKVLDRNSDKIYGYGFRRDCFFILVSQHLSEEERQLLRKEISCAQKDEDFYWEIKYEWTKSVQFQKYFGQGSPLYPERNQPNRYGTLGGFAEVNKTDMVGLSSYHVFLCNNVNAFVKDGENVIPLGVCSLLLTPGPESLTDIALIKIDNNPNIINNCEKLLVNDENEPKNAEIYMGSIEDLLPGIVHKKGATTGITQGAVVEYLHYREILGERETKSMFIVKDTGEEFCKRGDSGSLVFRNDLSVDQTGIEVIAILSGRFEQNNSDHVLCSSMKYIFEKLEADGKTLRFFTKGE